MALWLFKADGHEPGPADYEARLASLTGPWTERFARFDAVLDRCHPVGVPHHYLAMIAVRPDRQGAGIGASLLRAYHQEMDKQEEALAYLEAARELIARAHVLVENFPPGTLEGWGFDIDSLRRLRPNLVLLRISHFGQCGPWRDRPATSLTVQAASGWVSSRDPDRPPVQVGARIAEYVAGGYGALGALTALLSVGPRSITNIRMNTAIADLAAKPSSH